MNHLRHPSRVRTTLFADPARGHHFLVCAGDVSTKGIVPSIQWLADVYAQALPVIFVPGNHEFYSASVEESIRDARKFDAGFSNIHFLENDGVEIGGVRFIGGTLWTDFRLFGRNPAVSMPYAQSGMNDFRKIKFSKLPCRMFKPIDACRMRVQTRDFIAAELRKPTPLKTVVIATMLRLHRRSTSVFDTIRSPLVMPRIWKTCCTRSSRRCGCMVTYIIEMTTWSAIRVLSRMPEATRGRNGV
ncbi:metallophosphoesterase [Rhizobium tropici]|uniref:metallophosphoesterase n=1 Tax=Rhizobium tropici TaxID=398 RepID=UPI0032B1F17A